MSTEQTTGPKKAINPRLKETALQKENVRLQKQIAELEAALLTARNKIKMDAPIVRAAQKKAAEQQRLSDLAEAALYKDRV
jgi:hypothetical protein